MFFLVILSFFAFKFVSQRTDKTLVINEQKEQQVPPLFSSLVDLDEDGKNEVVQLFIDKNRDGNPTTVLSINGQTVVIEGHNPQDHFSVVDLDTKKIGKEIALTDEGPSSDFTTGFVGFIDGKVRFLGLIPGGYEGMKFLGDGSVVTLTRAKVLDTWFFRETYRLSDAGVLEAVPASFYERESPTDEVTALVPVKLSKEPTSKSVVFTIQKGVKGKILGCDNVAWCKARFGASVGWFEVRDFGFVVSANLMQREVFDGLSYAD